MSNTKAIQAERNQLFKDVYESRIPKRVPVDVSLPFSTIAEVAGVDLLEAYWDPQRIEPAVEYVAERMYTDVVPGGTSLRYPSYYQTLQSQSFVMGSSGVFQHPDVSGMNAEDYEYLISNPLECIYEVILPRLYKGLNMDNPVELAKNFTKALWGFKEDHAKSREIVTRIAEKYGYSTLAPLDSDGFTEAPYDFLADTLRGFRGIAVDVRRRPKKLNAAVEALYPILVKKGLPKAASEYGHVFFPLHMPTFMQEADFAKHWWPTFKRMVEEYASMGIHCKILCEDNWDRYLDYLNELPTNTIMIFEYGTPKLIKEKVGKRHIISGLYPVTYFQTHTKEECVDLAKAYIDTLAPGGKYIFGFDKSPLSAAEVDLEKFNAMTETVRDYGVYTSNVGEVVGHVFHKEDYSVDPKNRSLESKYYLTEEHMRSENPSITETGAKRMATYEDEIFDFLNFLLM